MLDRIAQRFLERQKKIVALLGVQGRHREVPGHIEVTPHRRRFKKILRILAEIRRQ